MTEPTGEIPQSPLDADQVILANAQRLISPQTDGQEPLVLHISMDATVPTEDMLKLLGRTEQLSLATTKVGDVIWWRTLSGTAGYFVINEPYTDEGGGLEGLKSGSGDFLITRKTGHPLGGQQGVGHILGATFGSGLKKDTVMKGATLEYEIKVEEKPPKHYTTTLMTDMGIIKSGSLSSGQASNPSAK
jgi:hypothetical protein